MSKKVIITGSTGMVGKGVLLECLDSPEIESVLVINRRTLGIQHPKLKEILLSDMEKVESIQDKLKAYDACFFCMGISAFRLSEEEYTRITHNITLNFAKTFLKESNRSIFCYVSGAGTDSTEKGKMMWARVKGRTENDLLKMPFKNAYMFRPGFIQPLKGIRSKTKMYNALYVIFKPLYYLLKLSPKLVTNTTNVGLAMINSLNEQPDIKILRNREINNLAKLKL